jgi:hypothetical protein
MTDPVMMPAPVSAPAKPQRLKAVFERSDRALQLSCRAPAWGRGVFVLLWLIGWTVGCVFLVNQLLRNPKLGTALFAVPFLASWVLVFCILLKTFFQIEELVLDRAGLLCRKRVFFPLKNNWAAPINSKPVPAEDMRVKGVLGPPVGGPERPGPIPPLIISVAS